MQVAALRAAEVGAPQLQRRSAPLPPN